MSQQLERDCVVAEARRWLGTPYHAEADVRGAGVDCGMLIVRVFVDTGLVPPFDPRPYPPDWHLHRDDEKYLGFVSDYCGEIAVADAKAGDIIVFRYGRCHAHGTILTTVDPLTVVHAFSLAHAVIEECVGRNCTLSNGKRDPRAFSFWASEHRQ